MEPKARHILIGLFTVVSVILIVLFTLWMAKVGTNRSYNYYKVEFVESVNGLSPGSAVQYSGVQVGDIVELVLDRDDPRRVLALVRIDSTVPLHQGVKARLQPLGVTGQAVISFSGGSPDQATWPEVDSPKSEKIPVILATPSPLSQLLNDGQNMMSSLTEASLNLSKVLTAENAQHVSNILRNIDQLTGVVSGENEQIKSIIMGLDDTVKALHMLLGNLQQLSGTANQLLSKEGVQAFSDASRAMNSLAVSGGQLTRILRNNEGAFANGMQSLNEVGPALIQFKQSFSTLQNILRNMEENPATYFLNGDQLKEFKP